MARHYRENLNQALEEGLLEFLDTAIPVEIDAQEWLVHPNVNLYVDCTTRCLNRCGFCIARTTDGRLGRQDVSVRAVVAAIDFCAKYKIKHSIQLTGGEPALHPAIGELSCVVTSRGLKTVLNTTLPVAHCMFPLFGYINVSAHHYNNERDAEVFQAPRDHKELGRAIWMVGPHKVRLNCNLVAGYVDTYGEIMQYIAWAYHAMGVANISFSWMNVLPRGSMYAASICDYVQDRPVPPMGSLLRSLEKTSHWRFLKYRGGVACYYELWHYLAYERPVLVQFKYSNNNYMDMIDQSPGYIPDMVVHPDGSLTASWDTRLKVLLPGARKAGQRVDAGTCGVEVDAGFKENAAGVV